MYREDKATAMAARFLTRANERTLNDLVLMKLMVIAEREAMREITARITGAQFVSMPKGPVLSEVLDTMRSEAAGRVWNEHIRFVPFAGKGTASNHCTLIRELDAEEYLSGYEIALVDRVWDEHGCKHKWDLVDLTHTFPEWEDTKSSRPISYVSIFEKGFHESPKVAREKAREIEYFESVAC